MNKGVVAMRTNIVIDDDLLNEAFLVSNARTKKDHSKGLIFAGVLVRLRKSVQYRGNRMKPFQGL